MKTTSNKDMLNAIRNQASEEYKERIPMMEDGIDARTILATLNSYPSIKNEFITTLTNKVVRTDFFSRIYTNPLKMLKKGMLPYGQSIEELFVMAAEAQGFFGGSTGFDSPDHTSLTQPDDPQLLIKNQLPDVKALYITVNFAHVFKTSISDAQLKAAFTSANGLSELVNQLVGSLTNGAEQREYKDMITLLKAVAMHKQIKTNGKGLIDNPTDSELTSSSDKIPVSSSLSSTKSKGDLTDDKKKKMPGVLQVMSKYEVKPKTGMKEMEALSIAIRTLAGRMKFVSTKYNMAGVPTFCNPEDLVFLTTPEIVAELDVMVLAQAFNVSSADVKTRIILVDELPKKWAKGNTPQDDQTNFEIGYIFGDKLSSGTIGTLSGSNRCLGILMDKNFIQSIDTVNEARQFENGRSLTTNMFLHRQGILSNCYFSNCVALFDDAGYDEVKPKTN